MSQRLPRLTIGLDLGDKISDFCVLDAQRNEVARSRVPTSPEGLRTLFETYPGADVVFEVGTHSPWIQRLAKDCAMGRVIAADPRQLKLISQSQKKTDRRDAWVLARAGQGLPELLCPVEHRSPETHADLALLRTRDLLVRERTVLVNRIRGLVKQAGHRLPSCTATYFFRRGSQGIPELLRPACEPLLAVLATIHEQIRSIERRIRELVRTKYPVAQQLQTIYSVGELIALHFVLTIENPHRIVDSRKVGAYLGLTPRKNESGQRAPELGITKAGDSNMRRLLVQGAHHLLYRGKDCRLRRWGLELAARGGKNAKKRAAIAIARKLAVLMLTLWKNQADFDPWYGLPREERPDAPQAA